MSKHWNTHSRFGGTSACKAELRAENTPRHIWKSSTKTRSEQGLRDLNTFTSLCHSPAETQTSVSSRWRQLWCSICTPSVKLCTNNTNGRRWRLLGADAGLHQMQQSCGDQQSDSAVPEHLGVTFTRRRRRDEGDPLCGLTLLPPDSSSPQHQAITLLSSMASVL